MTSLKIPGSLSRNIVEFCVLLRNHGFNIGPKEESETLQLLSEIPFSTLEHFKRVLGALLAKNREQQLIFDDIFNRFWQEIFDSFDSKVKTSKTLTESPPKQKTAPELSELKSWLFQHDSKKQEEAAFYSRGKPQKGRLKDYEGAQVSGLIKVLQRFTRDWANQQSRRFKSSKKPRHSLDLRKSLRKNIYHGELVSLAYRQRKIQKLDLVVLCDVSRSMELFSRFTVQLLYAFQNNYRSMETFVFGTQLHRISKSLQHHNFEEALKTLGEAGFFGGTKIGSSLHEFIENYGSHLLNKRTLVLVISDGWDTGELDQLEWSMSYIHRRVKKVLWLNPQAGKPGYTPQVAGMKAALPYIDIFQGVHNLESLQEWQRGGYKSL